MTKKDVTLEQSLCELYYNPMSGYQSQEQLYKDAKQDSLQVSREKVKKWFEHQSTYTRVKQPTRSFRRRQTYVSSIGEQLQMDLVDMSKYENENDGYLWILTAIDVFSRFAFCTPVRRKHEEFMEPAVKRVLEEHKKKFDKYPDVVQFDDGGEFYNQRVLPLLKSLSIGYFSTRLTSKKAVVVKRFNRTLKTKMWKLFDHENTKEWIDVLDLLVDNINGSKNRSIGLAPEQVSKDNSHEVFAKLYGHVVSIKEPKFKKGGKIGISKYPSPFYNQNKTTF